MKKNLIFLFVMLTLGFTMYAQKASSVLIDGETFARQTNISSSAKATDTTDMYPFTFSLPCGDSLTFYGLGGTNGYLTGNNVYSDKEKGMLIRNQGKAEVVEVWAYLLKRGNVGTGTTSVNIYAKGANNLPGALLGTSQVKVLSSVASGMQQFTFTNPIHVDGDFFANVVLPTVTGDTIIVVSSKVTCTGPDSSAVEKWGNNLFTYMKTEWNGFNADLTIIPSIIKNYTTEFNVVNANGNISATVDGNAITSIATVRNGKDLVFTASPNTGFVVKEWKLNGTVIPGNTSTTYTLTDIQENSVVTVEFDPLPFPITFNVVEVAGNTNGNLTATVETANIASGNDVLAGKEVIFTAVPATDYRVKEWKLDGNIIAGNTSNEYTLTVNAAALVTVEFEEIPAPTTFTVNFSVVGTNGTLAATVDGTPITSIANVEEGKDVIFTATPIANYQIKEWTIDGTPVAGNTSGTYALTNIQANVVITVEFEQIPAPITYTVDFSVVGANGTLAATVEGNAIISIANVEEGKDVIFTATPSANYQIKEWTVGGAPVAGNTSITYTLTNIQANTVVTVEFEEIPAPTTYTVDFSVVGSNGSIAATVEGNAITSIANVEEGKNVIFTATPSANYQVKEWKLNGTIVAGNTTTTYTLTDIQANTVVTVEFEEIPATTYTVAFSVVGTNGTLTATVDGNAITSIANVEEGKSAIFTATPANNYRVKEWKLNNNIIAGNTASTYTLANIQANAVVTVEFELDDTRISKNSEVRFSVFPNPAVDNIQFNADNNYVMNIMNINGQVVKSQNVNSGSNQINISNLHKGIYFVQFINNERTYTVKLIKK